MATLTSLLSELRDLTRTTNTDITDARGTVMFNRSLSRMQDAHNWRGQEFTDATLSYLTTDDGISVPADFISEEELYEILPNVTNPSAKLRPISKLTARREWWERILSNQTPNASRYPASSVTTDDGPYYYVWQQKLYLVPNPTATKTLVLDYYRRLADLAVTTNESNFFTVVTPVPLLTGAEVEAWRFLQEDERVVQAEARFGALLGQAIKNDRTLASSGGPRSRGT